MRCVSHWNIVSFSILRTSRFASFPEYMVVQMKKFTFGVDWVPKKLGLWILVVVTFLWLHSLIADRSMQYFYPSICQNMFSDWRGFLFIICVCLSQVLLCNSDRHMLCVLSNAWWLVTSEENCFSRCEFVQQIFWPAEGTVTLLSLQSYFGWSVSVVLGLSLGNK